MNISDQNIWLGYPLKMKLREQAKVHFIRESWNRRMKACRGIGASLTEQEIAPDAFDILHYGAIAELKAVK